MIKLGQALVVLLSILAAPVSANAGALVWMHYVDGSASGDISIAQNGSPGAQLLIDTNFAGAASFTVELRANISPDGGNLATTSTTLTTNASSIAVSNATATLPAPTNGLGPNIIESGFEPGNILTHFGQGGFMVGLVPADDFLIGTITFDLDFDNDPGTEITIDGLIGNLTWALLAGVGVDPVIFGDGPGTNGANFGEYAGTFATIRTPEPTTLCLFGIGTIALVRRRR